MRTTRVTTVLAAAALAVTLVATLVGCGDEPTSSALSVHRSGKGRSSPTAEETAAGSKVVGHVASSLYGPLAQAAGDGNLVFSPLRLAASLGYVHAGASGATAHQLDQLFGPVGKSGVDVDRAIAAADDAVEDYAGPAPTPDDLDAEVELHDASAIWGDASSRWSEDYLDQLATRFGGEAMQVDFARDVATAGREIDDWEAEHTAEAVKGFLPDGAIDAKTRILLTSLATLDAPWYQKLTTEAPAPFTRPDGSKVTVPMVGATIPGRHATGEIWQSITVPLVGQRLAVTFILPAQGKLSAVEHDLGSVLDDALAGSELVETTFTLPAFAIDREVPVQAALKQAGVTAPFAEAGNDLAATGYPEGQGIDAIVHRATVGVDAEGVHLAGHLPEPNAKAKPAPISALRFDRTFLFVVQDAVNATPVLIGRVTDPTAS